MSELPPDPSQRRRDLVEFYDRNGYPERARYHERATDGTELVRRLSAGDVAAVPEVLAWWTGVPPKAELDQLCKREALLSRALAVKGGRHAKIELQLAHTQDALIAELDEILVSGLVARVNTFLQPLPPFPSPDSQVYEILKSVRQRLRGPLPSYRVSLRPPHHDGITHGYLVVCERCASVTTANRAASRCSHCAKRRPLPRDPEGAPAIRVPAMYPGSFLVRQKPPATSTTEPVREHVTFVKTCEVCGDSFAGKRNARMHARCRKDRWRVSRTPSKVADGLPNRP